MTDHPSANFPWFVRMHAMRRKLGSEVDDWAMLHNVPAAAHRMLRNKATVPAMSWADVDMDSKTALGAFFDTLRAESAFYRLANENKFTRLPSRVPIGVTSDGAVGWIVNEGKPAPLSRITLASTALQPIVAAGQLVMSFELIRNVSPSGQSFFSKSLRGAVTGAVDTKFFQIAAAAGAVEFNSTGDDEDSVLLDLWSCLSAVRNDGKPTLFWIASSDTAKRAATFPRILPNASPTGGEWLNTPVIVTSALEEGTMLLLDASGFAADVGPIDVQTSEQADVEMLDSELAQDATTAAGAMMVSMYQVNAMVIKLLAVFAAERMRNDAVAVCRNVNWQGGAVTA